MPVTLHRREDVCGGTRLSGGPSDTQAPANRIRRSFPTEVSFPMFDRLSRATTDLDLPTWMVTQLLLVVFAILLSSYGRRSRTTALVVGQG